MEKKATRPLVSLGVPVYNKGEFLSECLQSILDQEYQNWECVIIDNQSTDNSNEVARHFAEKDKRFILIRNESFADQTTNWNIAFKKSNQNAKYFKLVLADDWLFPNYLTEMVSLMEKDDSIGVSSSYQINGRRVTGWGLDYYDGEVLDGLKVLKDQLYRRVEIAGSANTVLMRNETLKKVPTYPDIYHQGSYMIDVELFYDLLNVSNLGFKHKILSYTRRYEDTYTHQYTTGFQGQLAGNNYQLYKYKHLDEGLEKVYRHHRMNYAYFYAKALLFNNKDFIKWHNRYLHVPFTRGELTRAILLKNPVMQLFSELLIRLRLKKRVQVFQYPSFT
ncbi:MAG: glycosyltransferase family 2 protein [Bacteroidota bacterium]